MAIVLYRDSGIKLDLEFILKKIDSLFGALINLRGSYVMRVIKDIMKGNVKEPVLHMRW